jgi:hypothetical protein
VTPHGLGGFGDFVHDVAQHHDLAARLELGDELGERLAAQAPGLGVACLGGVVLAASVGVVDALEALGVALDLVGVVRAVRLAMASVVAIWMVMALAPSSSGAPSIRPYTMAVHITPLSRDARGTHYCFW